MISYDFSGQTVVVTGGTRGIGAGISAAFLRSGARVVATYASDRVRAEAFSEEMAEHGEALDLRCFDVGQYDQVEAFYRYIDSRYECLDILVNNAGIRRDSVVGMMKREDWDAVLRTNLTGVYNMSKFAVHKMMQARYGRIITITSPAGELGFSGQSNYAASKAGEVAFTKSLSKEVAKRGITVNCVSPGFIETDFISELPESVLKNYRGMVPLKRFGSPEDVANAVLFIASKQSSYVTGAALEVTGGL